MKAGRFLLFTAVLICGIHQYGWAVIPEGPYLQNVAPTAVTVSLTSSGPDAIVEYGIDRTYGRIAFSNTPIPIGTGSHPLFQVHLTGLMPATEFHYRVISGGVTGEDRRFTTTVNIGDPFVFCAYGDSRQGGTYWGHAAVVNAMAGEHPDFVIHSGDMVLLDNIPFLWQDFFHKEEPLISESPLFSIRGNHDMGSNLFATYMDNPTSPSGGEYYYSFDYGNAHFVALDTNLDICSGDQIAFLEADLAAHSNRGPLFVYLHEPPFSNGEHGGNQDVHDCWVPLFQEYGVDIVFGGHDHLYTRYGTYPVGSLIPGINGVNYIVTAGAGAPLYQPNFSNQPPIAYTEASYHYTLVHVAGTTIDVTAKRVDGSVMDHVAINATANDGQFSRTDPLPPKGDGTGGCGTFPSGGNGSASRVLGMSLYVVPAVFVLGLKKTPRNRTGGYR